MWQLEKNASGFKCDRCSHCCRSHRVPLTRADVRRLEGGPLLAAQYAEFLDPEQVEMAGEPESFARLREGRRVLMLRHLRQSDAPGCVFLQASGCSVHERRPDACRTYPYDRPEAGEALGLAPGAMCPPESGVLVTLRSAREAHSREDFLRAVRKRDEELKEHALFIVRWNRRQRTRIRLGRAPQSGAEFLLELLGDSGDTT